MFTGIIETLGKVTSLVEEQDNITFTVESSISNQLKIDQSVSHDGVCLTVIELAENTHSVTAIKETIEKSNFSSLQVGEIVNLERCMPANGRFDGHIVQGHVDATATLTDISDQKGSYVLTFLHNHPQFSTVEKGCITINGISLTVVNSKPKGFSVAIIPYTWEHTNLKNLKLNDRVNLEFDILGKYIQQYLQLQST